jgi:Fanconi anemia group M protein
MLEEFSNSDFNILVSSSVGEEGLDIPQVDLVIFYEPVPSAIRKIQRSGRTGRLDDGRIIMLITKDTVDEVYYHVARNKEKRMYRTIDEITKNYNNGTKLDNDGTKMRIDNNTIASNNSSANSAKTLMDYENKSSSEEQHTQSTKLRVIADYREKQCSKRVNR